LIGVFLAFLFARSGLLGLFLQIFGEGTLASFVSGLFFTSAFTIAPSTVALVHIAENIPTMAIAFWGALGAMIGDVIIFIILRDVLAKDLSMSLRPTVMKHFLGSLHLGFFKWILPLVGALVIISPLPDELGLALMGLSRMKIAFLLPISFCLNMIGIYTIIIFAQYV